MKRRREQGKGSIGCIFGLIVLAIVVMVGVKVIPAKVAVAEMKDYSEEEAQRGSLPRYTDEIIHENIFERARELNLPVTKEEIKVRRTNAAVFVDYKFRVVLEFPGYTYAWDVEEHIERARF